MVVARTADVGMEDRRAVRQLVHGLSIELVVEDGTDRSVGKRADLDGARGGSFQTCNTERWAHDAEARSETLPGMRSALQDQLTERGSCRPDEGGVCADTADDPVGITAMTERHVRMLAMFAVAASSHVHGNALASGEDLHGAPGRRTSTSARAKR